MLRQSGVRCRVIVAEMMEKKIKTAKVMGFEVIDAGAADPVERVKQMTGGRGADAVIVAPEPQKPMNRRRPCSNILMAGC